MKEIALVLVLLIGNVPEKEENDRKTAPNLPLEEQVRLDEAQKELEKESKRVFDLYKALEIPKQEPESEPSVRGEDKK